MSAKSATVGTLTQERCDRAENCLSLLAFNLIPASEFFSKVRESAKNARFFHHYMRGARAESTLGWNLTTPMTVVNAWLQTSPCSADESSSRKTRGLHMMERRVEYDVRDWENPRKNLSSLFFGYRPICPLLTVHAWLFFGCFC